MAFKEYDESNFMDTDSGVSYKASSYKKPAIKSSFLQKSNTFDWSKGVSGTKYGADIGALNLYKEKIQLKTPGTELTALPEGIEDRIGGSGPESKSMFSGFGVDGESLSGYAQLGGLAMQLLGYSDREKYLRAQTAGLIENGAQAKIDNKLRNDNRAYLGTAVPVVKPKTTSGIV